MHPWVSWNVFVVIGGGVCFFNQLRGTVSRELALREKQPETSASRLHNSHDTVHYFLMFRSAGADRPWQPHETGGQLTRL
jgi:hypothetical protein